MMLTIPKPDVLNGESLAASLHAAGLPIDMMTGPTVVGDTLELPGLGEEHRAAVDDVLESHDGSPLIGPGEAARAAFRDAVSSAATLQQLKDALLGTNTGAEPAVRPGRGI